jgi:hypothetical protein
MKTREVKRIVRGKRTIDGAGVRLIRVLSRGDTDDIDPFLMMDAFGSDNPADYIAGFPMHPHRGIETITYLLEGRIDHRDSIGNSGSLTAGELQWMTSGSGILHEEMPQETEILEGLQFWLNMPRRDKMAAPSYFPITPDMLTDVPVEGGRVRLIAGEYGGAKGVQGNYVPITMMDVELKPQAAIDIPIPASNHCFVYLFRGSAIVGSTMVDRLSAAILDAGDTVSILAGDEGVRLVLLAGDPLKEPIAWGGPIVMNTEEELRAAFRELNNGTFIK